MRVDLTISHPRVTGITGKHETYIAGARRVLAVFLMSVVAACGGAPQPSELDPAPVPAVEDSKLGPDVSKETCLSEPVPGGSCAWVCERTATPME